MPEGPEVKNNSIALAESAFGKELISFSVVSGRYSRNELAGLDKFSSRLPTRVSGVGCHGKFVYIMFSNGFNLWSTFGMSGRWSKDRSKHSRLHMSFKDGTEVFFNDVRNFGTAKLVYGPQKLISKLQSLGLDLLSEQVHPTVFISRLRDKDSSNICKVLMDQSILAGVGNYIKAESLWKAAMDPRKLVEDFEDYELLELKDSIESIMKSSFDLGGASFRTHEKFSGDKGNYSDRFLCYNRKIDADGNVVEKIKTPDGRTTHWSPIRQG